MKLLKLAIAAILLCGQACSGPVRQQPVQNTSKTNSNITQTKPPSSFNDTLLIDKPSAVFYHPDSLQDLHIKAITDTGVYKSSVHENFYQMRYSRIVLHKYYPAIKIIEARNLRYLQFKKLNGGSVYIDLNSLNDPSGLLVFDGSNAPVLVDMTNVETGLDAYFKK